jgi:hypothetical protein
MEEKKKRRSPTRRDGRLSTVIYLKEDLLNDIQEIARENDETTWRYVERVLSKAVKMHQKKGTSSPRG